MLEKNNNLLEVCIVKGTAATLCRRFDCLSTTKLIRYRNKNKFSVLFFFFLLDLTRLFHSKSPRCHNNTPIYGILEIKVTGNKLYTQIFYIFMNVHSPKNHIFMNVHSLKNHTFMNLSPLAIILPINPTLLIREKKVGQNTCASRPTLS